jgi:hypothetical protein
MSCQSITGMHNAHWGAKRGEKGSESYSLQGCDFLAEICVKGSTIVFKMNAAGKNVFTRRKVLYMSKWPKGLAKTMGASECVKAWRMENCLAKGHNEQGGGRRGPPQAKKYFS